MYRCGGVGHIYRRGGSCRHGVGHVGVGESCSDGVGHAGVGWVI